MSRHNDDPGERRRVYGRIAPVIMQYYRDRAGDAFHVETLRQHVLAVVPDVAPDSPGRILRELRLEGKLSYTVLNRRQSLYQFTSRWWQ